LRIYYPELKKSANKRVGLEIEEVFPRFYPGTKLSMFEELPPWMLSSLIKEEKNVFRVLKREPQIHSKNVS